MFYFFFFQAEDGIRYLVRSRGLGDVYKRQAKYWLPVKPGTDIALLLAWANLLVSEGRYDKAFVEKYGHGFDKFAAEISGYTPEWAAEPVSYTHLRAHETVLDLVCRLLLEKKTIETKYNNSILQTIEQSLD